MLLNWFKNFFSLVFFLWFVIIFFPSFLNLVSASFWVNPDEFVFKFIDKAGNEGTAIAKVDWITKEPTDYIIGDVNLDGKITATDLILIKRLVLQNIKTN